MTERLAVFVHGMAATLNLLGVAYNFLASYEKMGIAAVFDRDVLIHAASFEYHRRSALRHRARIFVSDPKRRPLRSLGRPFAEGEPFCV